MSGCEGDSNAGVGSGGGVVVMSVYMGGSHGSGALSSAGGVLEMSVVRGVGEVFDMCMARAGWKILGVSGRHDWVLALPILEEHGENGICVCVLVVVVLGQGLGEWGGVMSVCVVSLDSLC